MRGRINMINSKETNINISTSTNINTNTSTSKLIHFIEKYYYLLLALVFIMLLVNLFYRIDIPNIDFDEARHGTSAYEMIKNGDYIINTYAYKKDYWNLKPPISFWFIILGYKLFGFNTLGLRFFSIVSAVITVAIVTSFTRRNHGKTAAIITAAMLATFTQPILSHCSRGGEADALYILFYSAAIICTLLTDKGYKYLYLGCFFSALAFLTKSWHVFPVCATITLYLLYSGQFKRMKLKQWLLAALSFLLPILIWAIVRYSRDGITFFKGMIGYDLLKRSAVAIEGHIGGPLYYVIAVAGNYFYWHLLLIVAIIFLKPSTFKSLDKNKRAYRLGVITWFLAPIVLYSMASTKIEWYILPVYPPLAIIGGATFSAVLKNSQVKSGLKKLFATAMVIVLICYEVFVIYSISNFKVNEVQFALREIGQVSPYRGYKLYTAAGSYAEKGSWEQGHLLSAELYGDFIPCQGGLKAFLKDSSKDSLLFIRDSEKSHQYIEEYKLKIVLSKNGYYLLAK